MRKINLYLRLFTACVLASLQFALGATPSSDLCNNIDGFYSGTYVDPTQLFPNKAFALNVFLTHENNMIYGYTLPSNDYNGAKYGQSPYAMIWANCQNNQITNLYVIKNSKFPCGTPARGPFRLSPATPLFLTINYENAMINASLKATLFPSPVNQTVNQAALMQAQAFARSGNIQTCH